ncbi:hypothetical protein NLX71_09055 [Paenibacillus sp. MZ04-78.2]|uniref:O-antigen ligase family protein n=1 Tax=Paenibacillus sp. MZ04-78.2 TaxID=2962034 RepID=UPI0020B70EC9|nr:hypothetical protein [Paenibacillus sp. MZ04-78.2]MCP3773463.1 hypothetical protein [Paenibacillus sp. MZ04-78.2]
MCLGLTNGTSIGDIVSMGMTIFSYIMLFGFAIVLLPNYVSYENKNYAEIVRIFYFAILFSIGVSIVAGFGDPKSFHLDPYSLRNRYLACFQHPNSLGLYAFLGSVVSIIMHSLGRSRLYLLTVPFYLTLIVMSGSRTALYTVIAMLLIFMLKRILYTGMLLVLKYPFIFFPMLACLLFGMLTIVDRATLLEAVDKALSNRISIWSGLLERNESLLNFIIGQGTLKTDESMDNYYLVVLTSTGFLGLAMFVIMLMNTFYGLLKQFNETPSKTLGMIIAMMISLALYSFTESVMFTLGNAASIFLWSSVGICFQDVRIIRRMQESGGAQPSYAITVT